MSATNPPARRQAELDLFDIDRFAETAFADLARAAADVCDTPMVAISIVDGDRSLFRSTLGAGIDATVRDVSFCDHAIRHPRELLIVEDAAADPRFAGDPLVTGRPGIRFCAGAPLTLPSGRAIGAFCVMDTRPRSVEPARLEQLRFLADQVVAALDERRGARERDPR